MERRWRVCQMTSLWLNLTRTTRCLSPPPPTQSLQAHTGPSHTLARPTTQAQDWHDQTALEGEVIKNNT